MPESKSRSDQERLQELLEEARSLDVQTMHIKNRVKELRTVRASDLRPNPRNWRSHPQHQRDALCGVLAEIGYADALIARELPDGTLELIDGHLRAETTPDQEVPVLVLDVTEKEAEYLLATLDPLSSLAETDGARLDDLIAQVRSTNPSVQSLLEMLTEQAGDEAEKDLIPLDGNDPTVLVPCISFRKWRLPMSDELAVELEEKLRAWLDEHGVMHGAAEVIIRAL
ncbi:MAG: ParB N-terminal domain-containing protein [Candidatus Hydrogenedentales bacterium]|jgi:hypothetical protein